MPEDWFTDKCFRKQYTINRARGVFHEGKTYVVFQGPSSDPRIMAFDHGANSWSPDHLVGVSSIKDTDDHGNPGMCIDDNEKIHVIYGGHGLTSGEMRHRVSRNPLDITDFIDPPNPLPEPKATYPSLFTLSTGKLVYLYRGRNHAGGRNSHKADWYCTVSNDNGDSWSNPVAFLRGTEDKNPDDTWYIYAHAVGNEVHVAFTYHQCADSNHQGLRFNAYYIKRTANGTWVNARGDSFSLPISKAVANNNANQIRAHEFSNSKTMFCTVDADNTGKPYLSYGVVEGAGVQKYCANWTGSNWNVTPVAFHSGADRLNTRTVIFHRGGNDFSLFGFGDNGRDLVEYRTTDGNQTWSSPQILKSGKVDNPCILWEPHPDAYLFFDDDESDTFRHGFLVGESGFVGTDGISSGNGSGTTGTYECENLEIADATDDTVVVNSVPASNGQWIRLDANGAGDAIEFTVNVPNGTFEVLLQGRTGRARGQYQLSINGVNQGPAFDQFQSTSVYKIWNLGSRTFNAAGDYTFKFECTGKSSNSNGFKGSFDFIRLAGGPTVYECESLLQAATDDAVIVNNASASNGQWMRLDANAAGDSIEFRVEAAAGTYSINLRGRTGGARGRYQLSIDGVSQGPVIDQFQVPSIYKSWSLGNKTLNQSGNHTFKFECVGKSDDSNGFNGSFDFIMLE